MFMDQIEAFRKMLTAEEKAPATVQKYVRDARTFFAYMGDRCLTKELAIAFKQDLLDRGYGQGSVNGMIASVNKLLAFLGRQDCRLRALKLQRQIYRPEEQELTKGEYMRLVHAAEGKENQRLSLILQTVCATGIRISELSHITVEAVQAGKAVVSCKGKVRTVFIVRQLQKKLQRYIRNAGLKSGSVFVTRTGRPVNRSNIWREMKNLCQMAQVDPQKVFPHNLRHLFARIFYGIEKDIVKLADVLGHSSINTTRIYIMTTGEEHRRHMERMRLIA